MGSSVSALSSFNGTSKFASSLQQVLTRAVGIASLPLNSLQATQTTLGDRQNALQGLDARFSALQSSLTNLDKTVQSGVLNSSISDGTVVSASISAGALAGTYSIEVDSLGASSTALSVAGTTTVTDPGTQGLTSSTSFSLTAGGTTTAITAASSSLQDVAAAINLQAGSQAQASIVNIGSSSAPDYRLSLRGVKLGTDPIALTDGNSTDLIGSSTAGSLATYTVDGSDVLSSDSRTITLAPGVTANLLGQSTAGKPVTVTVKYDATGVGASFAAFAQNYNSAVDALGQYHGSNAGALEGDSLVTSLESLLSHIANYSGGTAETSLSNYGIALDKSGHLSVDSHTLTTAASANFGAFLNVLGGVSTGGFLQNASGLLDGTENAASGTIKTAESSVATQLTQLQNRISDEQASITLLQQNLIQQLAKADTAIAGLESKVSYVNGLFYSITGNNNANSNPSTL